MKLSPSQIEEFRSLLARCADASMTPQQIERLNELLAADAQAQQMFADYAMLNACLDMYWAAGEERESGDAAIAESAPVEEFAPVIIQASPVFHAPLSAFHSPLGSFLFSYTVAAAVVALGMVIAWACQVSIRPSDRREIVNIPRSPAAPLRPESETVYVGRITGMVDCQWTNPHEAPIGFDRIVLGRNYALASGLMEITYDSGARVILQGPCNYKVESNIGGYLSLGRMTAKVEKSRTAAMPSGFFFIRTPTATVTDLGTEFGVEVDKSGASSAHVFQGRVVLRAVAGSAETNAVQLGANESARVAIDDAKAKEPAVTVTRGVSRPDKFVRRMPKRERIKLFNTGVDLKDGEPDPHWQVVARSDQPNFKPRPAVVSGGNSSMWLSNQFDRSQWISLSGGEAVLPDRVVYTFRTTFDLTGMRPATAVLHGQFVVDNDLQAIRLNGRAVRVPAHGDAEFGFFHAFSIVAGFVEGVNVLEFEVQNGARNENVPSSPMGLLVELEGSALSAWPEPSAKLIDAKINR